MKRSRGDRGRGGRCGRLGNDLPRGHSAVGGLAALVAGLDERRLKAIRAARVGMSHARDPSSARRQMRSRWTKYWRRCPHWIRPCRTDDPVRF